MGNTKTVNVTDSWKLLRGHNGPEGCRETCAKSVSVTPEFQKAEKDNHNFEMTQSYLVRLCKTKQSKTNRLGGAGAVAPSDGRKLPSPHGAEHPGVVAHTCSPRAGEKEKNKGTLGYVANSRPAWQT